MSVLLAEQESGCRRAIPYAETSDGDSQLHLSGQIHDQRGACPHPLIFRMPYGTRPFYIGDIAPTVTTSQYENNNFIMEFTPPQDGLNMDKDGMSARTIKSQYGKNSVANFIREDSMGATAVIEITPPAMLKRQRTDEAKQLRKVNGDVGVSFTKSKEYSLRTDGIANTLTANFNKENLIMEPIILRVGNIYPSKGQGGGGREP